MKLTRYGITGIVLILLFALTIPAFSEEMEEAPRISMEEVKAILDAPNVVIIDVRQVIDWRKSDRKILGAIRENPNDVRTWSIKYPKDKKIILYCS